MTAIVLLLSFGAFSSGCFGSFQVTRSLYDANRSVEDKYLRSVVTWIFIIPYGFTAVADFLVFNVIEFWSGSNPVTSAPVTRERAGGGGTDVLTLSRDGAATVAVLGRYEGGILVSTLRIRDDGNGKVTSVEVAAGRKVREATAVPRPDGSVDVTVTTSSGAATERVAAAAAQAEMARVARIATGTRHAGSGGAGMAPFAAARVPAHGG
jgi:hypothetical protein